MWKTTYRSKYYHQIIPTGVLVGKKINTSVRIKAAGEPKPTFERFNRLKEVIIKFQKTRMHRNDHA